MDGMEDKIKKLCSEQRSEEALEMCNKAIAEKGKSITSLSARAFVYLQRSEFEKALQDVDEGLKTPSITNADKGLLIEQKSKIFWEMSKLEEAIKLLEDHKHIDPKMLTIAKTLKTNCIEDYGLEFGNPTLKKIETFVNWMRDNGARFSKIRMKYYGADFRGVHAINTIASNETFLAVPRKLIITPQMGKDTEIGKMVKKSGVAISWDYLFYITLFLLEQFHDEKSWWKPYMDVYPRMVDSFPMFYSEEEKSLLKGSPMIDQIGSEIKEIKEEYERIVKAVPAFKKFSFAEYIKNKTLVISRIFFVTMNGQKDRLMVPLADMFNHYYDKVGQTYWKYEDSDNSFIVKAQRSVPMGDAICENYGQKPNYRFLFYYGFLIDNNKKNAVYIKLRLNKADPQIDTKEKMIGASRSSYIKTFKYFENFDENEKTDKKYISYLRFIEYEGDLNAVCSYLSPQVKSVKECMYSKRKLTLPPLSVENEEKALQKMKTIADKCLHKYPDSYEDDIKQLTEDKSLSFNVRNCLIFRSGEKKILKDMIEMADLGIGYLNNTVLESAFPPKFAKYLKTALIPLKEKGK